MNNYYIIRVKLLDKLEFTMKTKLRFDYVCKPSLFIGTKTSDFYMKNKEICDYECEFILNTQESDGTWGVIW